MSGDADDSVSCAGRSRSSTRATLLPTLRSSTDSRNISPLSENIVDVMVSPICSMRFAEPPNALAVSIRANSVGRNFSFWYCVFILGSIDGSDGCGGEEWLFDLTISSWLGPGYCMTMPTSASAEMNKRSVKISVPSSSDI